MAGKQATVPRHGLEPDIYESTPTSDGVELNHLFGVLLPGNLALIHSCLPPMSQTEETRSEH